MARARLGQWTARTEARFLATLAACGNVKAACSEVGMSATSAYEHRKRWSGFEAKWEAAIRESELRLQFAVIENLGNPMSSPELPPAAEGVAMRGDQAFHGLYMNKRRFTGRGGRPGLWAREPAIEAVAEKILRSVDVLKRAREIPERIAADREGWAERRRAPRRSGGIAVTGLNPVTSVLSPVGRRLAGAHWLFALLRRRLAPASLRSALRARSAAA